jgi:hypothetical protein
MDAQAPRRLHRARPSRASPPLGHRCLIRPIPAAHGVARYMRLPRRRSQRAITISRPRRLRAVSRRMRTASVATAPRLRRRPSRALSAPAYTTRTPCQRRADRPLHRALLAGGACARTGRVRNEVDDGGEDDGVCGRTDALLRCRLWAAAGGARARAGLATRGATSAASASSAPPAPRACRCTSTRTRATDVSFPPTRSHSRSQR